MTKQTHRESRESLFGTRRVGRVTARATAHARQTAKGESGESFSRESRESLFWTVPAEVSRKQGESRESHPLSRQDSPAIIPRT